MNPQRFFKNKTIIQFFLQGLFFAGALILLLSGMKTKASEKGRINEDNALERFGEDPVPFSDNPRQLEAMSKVKAWSGPYWPSSRGGVAGRWQFFVPWRVRLYHVLTPAEAAVSVLSPQRIAELSPAEKFDLLLGRLDFPLTHRELKHAQGGILLPAWYGLCHGLVVASTKVTAPRQDVEVRGILGHKILFYRDDIKALLSLLYSQVDQMQILGVRCEQEEWWRQWKWWEEHDSSCRDVNPGSFHQALIKIVGEQRGALYMDLNRGPGVRNFAIRGYKARSMVMKKGKDVDSVSIKMEVFTNKYLTPTTRPLAGADSEDGTSLTFHYRLEVDKNNVILGGEWQSRNFPDFLWRMLGDYENDPLVDGAAVLNLARASSALL
jgi:hypothetical protein